MCFLPQFFFKSMHTWGGVWSNLVSFAQLPSGGGGGFGPGRSSVGVGRRGGWGWEQGRGRGCTSPSGACSARDPWIPPGWVTVPGVSTWEAGLRKTRPSSLAPMPLFSYTVISVNVISDMSPPTVAQPLLSVLLLCQHRVLKSLSLHPSHCHTYSQVPAPDCWQVSELPRWSGHQKWMVVAAPSRGFQPCSPILGLLPQTIFLWWHPHPETLPKRELKVCHR